jgi:hypothetical protein
VQAVTDMPTPREIENVIHRIQAIRDLWHSNPGYARFLDIELRALRLLLLVTRITEEEAHLASHLGMGASADG